ncbi:MAG: RNA polymerase sigma factor [Myxococcota bacterium]
MPRPTLRVIPGGEGLDESDEHDVSPPASEPPDLGALFDAYASYVGAIALRLVGRPDEVDDIVQEVFLAAHKGLKRVDSQPAVRKWLAKVTVRTTRRRLRTLRAKGFLGLGNDPEYESLADHGASPEQRALVAHVYEILDKMPSHNRVAWVLRYVEGHRLEEVAELSGCSLATAKRRIAAARDTLKDALES